MEKLKRPKAIVLDLTLYRLTRLQRAGRNVELFDTVRRAHRLRARGFHPLVKVITEREEKGGQS